MRLHDSDRAFGRLLEAHDASRHAIRDARHDSVVRISLLKTARLLNRPDLSRNILVAHTDEVLYANKINILRLRRWVAPRKQRPQVLFQGAGTREILRPLLVCNLLQLRPELLAF